jgi:molybdopterin molybdotransferase
MNMMETMITVDRAIDMIKLHVNSLSAVLLPLEKSEGLVLAEDIISNLDIPAFPQSNMDGYAFFLDENITNYELVGEVAAGDGQNFMLKKGKAVRIFTGAAIPDGANTVLAQEQSEVIDGQLFNLNQNIKQGDHVRAVGTEIQKGQPALSKGTVLKPSSIGFLAGIGIHEVLVYPKPNVSIIVTGNELQQPGHSLSYGQVYESNSFTLRTALAQLHINNVQLIQVKDQLSDLTDELKKAIENADVVLMTGGVSVGDYDFTLKAFEQNNVNILFHKIKQKPGKPLLFGTKENKLLFGLPGNPASVLTCFYEYVMPAIGILMQRDFSLKQIKAPIAHDHKKPAGLRHFLKAYYDGEKVSLHVGQESYKLSSYALANCLAVFPEDCTEVAAGAILDIHLLP